MWILFLRVFSSSRASGIRPPMEVGGGGGGLNDFERAEQVRDRKCNFIFISFIDFCNFFKFTISTAEYTNKQKNQNIT